MVKRLSYFFDRELSGFHQAAFLLAMAAIASKLLALLRDRFLAGAFGAGKTLDIYYAAFVIPDYLYAFLLFVVSANALIPIFLEKMSSPQSDGHSFLNEVFTVFVIIIIASVAILFFATPFLIPFVAPGFSEAEQEQVITLSRILLLSPLLLGLSNMASSIIQSLRKFFIYSLTPVFYNLGIILGVLIFYRWWGLSGIAFGVVVGAFFHFFIQVPSLIRSGFLPTFTLKININEIKRIIKLSFPRALGLTFNQFVLTIITALASTLSAGSIAVFNLAINLQSIPLTIIGMSYGTAAFPTLAHFYAKNDKENFLKHIIIASRHIIFWSLPTAALFIVLRAQIVRVILGAGAFGWADTRLTAASLALLSLSIASQGILFLLIRAFYAAGRTKMPLAINFLSSLFVVAGSFLLIWLFKNFESIGYFWTTLLRLKGVSGAEMSVLPLIFSIGTILNTCLLLFFFQKEFGQLISVLKKTLIGVLLTSIVMGFVAYVSLNIFAHFLDIRTFWGILLQGLFSGIISLLAGFIILRIFKNSELEEIISFTRRKIRKEVPVVAPEPEKLL